MLLASFPVLGTLGTLRTALAEAEATLTAGAAPRVSPFPELRDLAGLMQRAGFELPVADADTIDLAYRDPLRLLYELRAAGEANAVAARHRRPPHRLLFPMATAAVATATAQAGQATTPVRLRLGTVTGFAPLA